MPIYLHKCKQCEFEFEDLYKNREQAKQVKCPKCGYESEVKIAPTNSHFKGSGFYSTDYKGKA